MSRACLLSLLCCIALVVGVVPATASRDISSCITVPNCFSPGYTYKIVYTADSGACCTLCALDKHCLTWTRETHSGFCALKSDANELTYAEGVESGVKYVDRNLPRLDYNDIGALILVGKRPHGPGRKRGGSFASATAVATSTGGNSVAVAHSGPDGSFQHHSVHGNGYASTSVSGPHLSLAAHTTSRHGEAPKLFSFYYKTPYVKGYVPLRNGKELPVIYPREEETKCYRCKGFPCASVKGHHYKDGGVVLAEYYVADDAACCLHCRLYKGCVSWWINPTTGRCVLNSNLPKATPHGHITCGTVV